jgi:hypothetical protein
MQPAQGGRIHRTGWAVSAEPPGRIRRNAQTVTLILLNSGGGSVQAALKIAEILREHALQDGDTIKVHVRSDHRCYSACALIFAAGPDKFNGGVIGLHRPYFTGFQGENIENNFRALRKRLKEFAQSYGLSSEFVDQMMITDSDQMTYYVEDGIFALMPREDPVVEQHEIERRARFYHIDPGTMRAREQHADKVCGESPESAGKSYERWDNCQRAIKWGMPERFFRQHLDAINACYDRYDAYQKVGDCIHSTITAGSAPSTDRKSGGVELPDGFEVKNDHLK